MEVRGEGNGRCVQGRSGALALVSGSQEIRDIARYVMAYGVEKVGEQGEVVIDGRLREELGIGPGWFALQKVVDDRLEVEFLPPDHNESPAGIASEDVTEENRYGDED